MKDIIFTMEEIFPALQLSKDVTQPKKIPSDSEVITNLNKIEDPEKESIYIFNADDVNSDGIESDDEEEEV